MASSALLATIQRAEIARGLRTRLVQLLPERAKQRIRALLGRQDELPGLALKLELPAAGPGDPYRRRVEAERARFDRISEVHDLPPIFHYWSQKYVAPLLAEYGYASFDHFHAAHFAAAARATGGRARFLSLGSGNCDTEVRVAQLLEGMGLTEFVIECLDLSGEMLARGRELAAERGVAARLEFVQGDFNTWRADGSYAGVLANQSLHHIVELEHVFDEVRRALEARHGVFVTSDMIGRNGHQRWPEAIAALRRLWRELPVEYRYNRQLHRLEEEFADWDCSGVGFEGVRAEEVLRLLVERFHFHEFIGFANIADVFVDRGIGHNFDLHGAWDRDFIDRVEALDSALIVRGELSPTHMLAALRVEPSARPRYSRGLSPERAIRRERPRLGRTRLEIVTPALRPSQAGGNEYWLKLEARGGRAPYAWSGAALPPGLTLSSGGVLRGTLVDDELACPLIRVTDSSTPPRSAAQRYTIRPWTPPLAITGAAELAPGVARVAYREALTAQGGVAPYTWSIVSGSLPKGLELDAASGALHGTPARGGRVEAGVEVRDAAGATAAARLKLTVAERPAALRRVAVCPHVAYGVGWRTELTLLNPAPAARRVVVAWHIDGGAEPPVTPRPEDGGYTIAPHGVLSLAIAPSKQDEHRGWAEIAADGELGTELRLTFTDVDGRSSSLTPRLEADGATEQIRAFDNTSGSQTGLGLLNLSGTARDTLVVTAFDEHGSLLSVERIGLSAGRHKSFLLAQRLRFTAGRRGTLRVRAASGGAVAALALCVDAAGVYRLLAAMSQGSPGDAR
jgi:SAM-dependent methyltransferase